MGNTKGKEGFSLMETVLAVMLLAVGLGAAATTYQLAMRWTHRSRNEMIGLHLARTYMERLQSLSWDAPELESGDYLIQEDGITGDYEVKNQGSTLKKIRVRLKVYDPNEQRMSEVELATTISQPLHK